MRRPRFRWFQFSLRSLLVAVTVFAVWLGWHVELADAQRDSLDALIHERGYIHTFTEGEKNNLHLCRGPAVVLATYERKSPAWVDRIVGRDFFNGVVSLDLVGDFNDVHLPSVARLHRLRRVRLPDPRRFSAKALARFHRNRPDVEIDFGDLTWLAPDMTETEE